MQDSTHSILRSARLFFSGTFLSRISGMLRDMALAFAFGTGKSIAAFFVAFRLAHLLRRIFGEGALQAAFVPQFEELRVQSPESAYAFFRDLTGTLSVALSALILFVMATLGTLLALFEFSENNQEILSLTLSLMPSLLFICLFGLNLSLLQCEKKYFLAGFSPVAFNCITIIGVFFLLHLPQEQAVKYLCGWVVGGCFCQWMLCVPALFTLREKKIWRGMHLFSAEVKRLIKPLSLGIIGVAATQINSAMDGLFARYAESSGPAFLWYALRIQQLPLALFGVAIAGALLPPLTRALKKGDQENYLHFLHFSLRRTLTLMLPITFLLLVMGDSVINLIFSRGDFSNASVVGTTICLWGYTLGLIPMSLVLILAPALYAKNNQRTPALASVLAMLLNLFLNAWFILGMQWGAASVAFSTSIAAFFNLGFLLYFVPELQERRAKELLSTLYKSTLVSLISALLVLMWDYYIYHEVSTLEILLQGVPAYPVKLIDQLQRVLIDGSVFLSSLLFLSWITNVIEPQRVQSSQR